MISGASTGNWIRSRGPNCIKLSSNNASSYNISSPEPIETDGQCRHFRHGLKKEVYRIQLPVEIEKKNISNFSTKNFHIETDGDCRHCEVCPGIAPTVAAAELLTVVVAAEGVCACDVAVADDVFVACDVVVADDVTVADDGACAGDVADADDTVDSGAGFAGRLVTFTGGFVDFLHMLCRWFSLIFCTSGACSAGGFVDFCTSDAFSGIRGKIVAGYGNGGGFTMTGFILGLISSLTTGYGAT